jgi:hypothetical protein
MSLASGYGKSRAVQPASIVVQHTNRTIATGRTAQV